MQHLLTIRISENKSTKQKGLSWLMLASSPPKPVNQPCQRLVVVASIEAPFTLLQEPVEVIRPDFVASAQAPPGMVPKVFYPIDIIAL